ncbi:hypothetical protein [Terribacillus sp. DMT04]|uniref:hypothetical protein n=1 Tax=Terribacillus sp. DMT04 TaxID=2850441 RepID=UPI001C2C4451|nr:hypothetical protein [Terribacillus sp. DMT04]QXE02374.1 hypothetical protein KS242_03875 [Terribacillus sp. DMT04]
MQFRYAYTAGKEAVVRHELERSISNYVKEIIPDAHRLYSKRTSSSNKGQIRQDWRNVINKEGQEINQIYIEMYKERADDSSYYVADVDLTK